MDKRKEGMASNNSEVVPDNSGGSGSVVNSSENQVDDDSTATEVTSREANHKPKTSFLRRIWSAFFFIGYFFHRSNNNDLERKLEHLSKEEETTYIRLKQRSETWRQLARGMIIYSVIIEICLLGIAVIMTRAVDLPWKSRALRVLPMFAFPTFVSLIYSACGSVYRMSERRDQKTLDRLRNERQAKIDELKEKTNYYLTQQLIHKYDSDPAAKEAAARVLASKLGADAGLALALEPANVIDETIRGSEGSRHTFDIADGTGLRRRKGMQRTSSTGQSYLPPGLERNGPAVRAETSDQATEIEQFPGKISNTSGGWVARLAAMLVGEDPTQCYALICKKCHMHNGLARKEDFQYIAYHCPHCHALNGSHQLGEADGFSSLPTTPRVAGLQSSSLILNASLEMIEANVELDSSENYTTASERSSKSSN